MIVITDTETTGIPSYKLPSDHPSQPYLVRLCARVIKPDFTLVREFQRTVKPEGWEIPYEAAAIHKITTEMAKEIGTPLKEVLADWLELIHECTYRVGHNHSFDDRILRIAFLRAGYSREQIEVLESRTIGIDTMKLATPIINLPPTPKMQAKGMMWPKSASLTECIYHFFGERFLTAHECMDDVRQTERLLKKLVEMGKCLDNISAVSRNVA